MTAPRCNLRPMKWITLIFCLTQLTSSYCQEHVLLLGNTKQLCFSDTNIHFVSAETLPQQIASYRAIMIFSSAHSRLSTSDIEQIISFVSEGGGLYIGSENWPLQAEGSALTERLYTKSVWTAAETTKKEISNNGMFSDIEHFPPGTTPVVFPLHFQLHVEVWYNDEPLILSGKWGQGKILIDGGYSRFYCSSLGVYEKEVLAVVLNFFDGH
jgi:hypothetical protein